MKLKVGDKLKLKPYNESLQLYGINIDDYKKISKNDVVVRFVCNKADFYINDSFWCFDINLIDHKRVELPNHLFEV